ncbi:putative ABC transporter [Curvularia clavata]|uniref:ABC transporter n=1 Tax=Curvularia clavata TaxID=95742 RepID=A0A9Q8ZLZ3_CURCL|nr:putative ABC transporter [Curvularia clavata]
MMTTPPSNGTSENESATAQTDEEQRYISKVGWKGGIVSTTVAALTMPTFAIVYGFIFEQYTLYGAGSVDNHTLMSNMSRYCVVLAAICALNWASNSFHYFCFLTFSELQARSARNKIFNALIEKDMAWFDTRSIGMAAFLPTVRAYIDELQLSVSAPLGETFQASIEILASLVVAFYLSWKLTLVLISGFPILYLIAALIENRQSLCAHQQSEKLHSALKYITTAISSIETVKCFNGEQYELRNFKTAAGLAARLYRSVANFRSMQIGLMQFFTISIFVQGFWYGKRLVDTGEGSAADILTTFWAVLMAMSGLSAAMPQLIVLTKGRVAGANLAMLVKQIPACDQQLELQGQTKPKRCIGDIEFKKVTFSYPSRTKDVAIRDVSIFIPAGETTFVIGKSGSGKSTLGQLLVRFYQPSSGEIILDGTSLEQLDVQWLRSNITLVEQHSVLFNDTICNNIAMGKPDETLHMWDILDTIKFSMLEEVMRGLPDGLDTKLGANGGSLSGGQRQRLALARAKIRDTPVLILDESTSALDCFTRAEIFESIRSWRKGKTTLVITHDISQIEFTDFVYLLSNGEVVQEGYRKDLETQNGFFQDFLNSLKEENEDELKEYAHDVHSWSSYLEENRLSRASNRHSFVTRRRSIKRPQGYEVDQADIWSKEFRLSLDSLGWQRMSQCESDQRDISLSKEVGWRPKSILSVQSPSSSRPYSQAFPTPNSLPPRPESRKGHQRHDQILSKIRHKAVSDEDDNSTDSLSIQEILLSVWPAVNWRSRAMICGAFICTVIHSVCTPLFAWVFAQLLGTFQEPASQGNNKARNFALAILAVATADGLSKYLMFFLSDSVAQAWSLSLKTEAMRRILMQPREFFDKEENSTLRLAETLDHFAEEARNLPGRFACIVSAIMLMIAISIVWSMVISWKLALVALAMGPILFAITKCNNMISNRWEKLSSEADDKVGEILNETFINIRTVRCLGLENHFRTKYKDATTTSVRVGIKRAIYCGSTYGLAFTSVIFLAILMYWYGALLMSRGEHTANTVQACFLILMMSVNYVSSLAQWITQINISRNAGTRLLRLARLPTNSHELVGHVPIQSVGTISFKNVTFTYPTRKDVPVLKNVSFTIPQGSCTAIVGSSGSGKSTIASLLLKLYQTDQPYLSWCTSRLSISNHEIKSLHTPSLRSRIALVSQTPVIFPGTIAQNIVYGLSPSSPEASIDSIRAAADAAGISDFIDSLSQGYNTLIGDGGTGLSGGQAQRLAIARALVRKPDVLVLDEATSALDVTSANVIRETVLRLVGRARQGRGITVVVITHAREMMAIAEHVVVLDQGRVVEQGSFQELRNRRGGAFGKMLRGEMM